MEKSWIKGLIQRVLCANYTILQVQHVFIFQQLPSDIPISSGRKKYVITWVRRVAPCLILSRTLSSLRSVLPLLVPICGRQKPVQFSFYFVQLASLFFLFSFHYLHFLSIDLYSVLISILIYLLSWSHRVFRSEGTFGGHSSPTHCSNQAKLHSKPVGSLTPTKMKIPHHF